MKKLSVFILSFILLGVGIVFVFANDKNVKENTSVIENILEDDSSTVEKSTQINEEISLKISACERIKTEILLLIDYLYDSGNTVSVYVQQDDFVEAFDTYYQSGIDKITAHKEVGSFLSILEYQTGSFASIQEAVYEYNAVTDFYLELVELYDSINNIIRRDGYMSLDES